MRVGKKALICGISGQDGAYLARLLLDKGYSVCGTSRDAQITAFDRLTKLGIRNDIRLESMALKDFRSVLQILLKTKPDEIYNLAGQSSVALSFEQPIETLESIGLGSMNVLEASRFLDYPVKIYNASSGECFGEMSHSTADEETPFRPRSPYAVAKAAAYWEVANYREAYGLYACSGLLFNHESPLRPERFVTKKIVAAACRIASGNSERLELGNIMIQRDWGWAPEYVEAMWLMLQQENPDDFVIATGETYSLQSFIERVFESLNLDWREWVDFDNQQIRPIDLSVGRANPKKAKSVLGWQAKSTMPQVVQRMVDAETSGAIL